MTRIELVIDTEDPDVIEVTFRPVIEIATAIRLATKHLDVRVSLEVDGSDEWPTMDNDPNP